MTNRLPLGSHLSRLSSLLNSFWSAPSRLIFRPNTSTLRYPFNWKTFYACQNMRSNCRTGFKHWTQWIRWKWYHDRFWLAEIYLHYWISGYSFLGVPDTLYSISEILPRFAIPFFCAVEDWALLGKAFQLLVLLKLSRRSYKERTCGLYDASRALSWVVRPCINLDWASRRVSSSNSDLSLLPLSTLSSPPAIYIYTNHAIFWCQKWWEPAPLAQVGHPPVALWSRRCIFCPSCEWRINDRYT